MEYAKDGKLWDYVLPKGGSRSPLRLGDFRGYNTDAPAPYINMSQENILVLPMNIIFHFALSKIQMRK